MCKFTLSLFICAYPRHPRFLSLTPNPTDRQMKLNVLRKLLVVIAAGISWSMSESAAFGGVPGGGGDPRVSCLQHGVPRFCAGAHRHRLESCPRRTDGHRHSARRAQIRGEDPR